MAQEHWTTCPGCGARVKDFDGPTHRYIGASAGCWALYTEVLAREYERPAYFAVHHLTVDTYCAQHPGQPSPQSVQSVAVHLISLCCLLEKGGSMEQVIAAKQRAAAISRERFVWLAPPENQGAVTILDVHAAATAQAHRETVRRWAESVWEAWSRHHARIREWAAL